MITTPNQTEDVQLIKPGKKDRFTTEQLKQLTDDINNQPKWRSLANRACDYYDGDQLEPEVMAKLRERGQPLTQHNLIAPTIDGVLGMEAKTRTSLMVIADDPDEEMEVMCEAVNSEFADACRLANMDKARSDAYAEQVKAGLSWVEVRRNPDPFAANKYVIDTVHRNEVYFDWHSRKPDLSDCRWLYRKRWIDTDQAKVMIPGKAEIIDKSLNDGWTALDTTAVEGMDSNLVSAYNEWSSFRGQENFNWFSTNRQRVMLQVVYYRTYVRMDVIELETGRVMEYDKNNLMHVIAVVSGRARLRAAQVSRIREAWFIGPHFIDDRECAAPMGMFPLIPFWGYRKDRDGSPYGLVARAMPAQDEVNFRRIKLTWLLQAKRIIADADATNLSRSQLQEEVERPDGYIPLNPQRLNKTTAADAINVQQDFQVASQQFAVMQESMKLIQDGMGVYSAFLGQESNAKSGVAISNLVEQGATTLAEMNDNYAFACQQVGNLLLNFLLEDMRTKRNYTVTVNRDDPRKRKPITLNQVTDGERGLNNDISRLRAHIGLAPVPQTPTYKAQMADRLSTVIVGLPPQVQASVLDMWVEMLDIPNKQEFVERIRSSMGTPKSPDEMTEEEQQAAAAQQQQQQAQMELAMREQQAKVSKMEAEAQRLQAQVQELAVKANSQKYDDAKTQAETGKILSEMQQWSQQSAALQEEFSQTLDQALDSIPLNVRPVQQQPVASS